MQQFPVSSSVLSSAALAGFIIRNYGLSPGATCKLIKTGINHSYLVEDGETKFVLRIYSFNWRTKIEVEEELKLLRLLSGNNVSVSYPIPAKNGENILSIEAPEGERFVVLFSYAFGDKVLHFNEDLHYAVGQQMGRIHLQTKDLSLQRIHYTAQNLLIDSFGELKPFFPIETEEMRYMETMQKRLLRFFDSMDDSRLRKGVVHLDIWFDNLHIGKDNTITIFDFDFCGNGWLALDLAYYLMQLQFLEPDPVSYKSKYDSFIKGYESVSSLTEEEKRVLPAFGMSLYFFYLGVQCNRFENWANTFINETYLKRYIAVRVKKFADFHHLESYQL